MARAVSLPELERQVIQSVIVHALDNRLPFLFMLRHTNDATTHYVHVPVHELAHERIAAVYADLRCHAPFVAADKSAENTVYIPIVFWNADSHESTKFHTGDYWSLWMCHYDRHTLRVDAQIHIKGLFTEVANSVIYRGARPRDVSEKHPLSAAAFTYYNLGAGISAGLCGVPRQCEPTDVRDYMKGAVTDWMTLDVRRSLRVSFERLTWTSTVSKQPDMNKPRHERNHHCTLHLAEYKGTAMQLLSSPLLDGLGFAAVVETRNDLRYYMFPLVYEGHVDHQAANRIAHTRKEYIAQRQQQQQQQQRQHTTAAAASNTDMNVS